jgi:hypothetical protein
MLRWITAGLTALCLVLAACVTINVFPAAPPRSGRPHHRGHLGTREGTEADRQRAGARPRGRQPAFAALRGTLDFVIPAAHAEADLDVSSPAIRTLTGSMKAAPRTSIRLLGAIGSRPTASSRSATRMPSPRRPQQAEQLVADDNRDRKALYAEIASANGHPDWEADIRSTFAERWIAKPRGLVLQVESRRLTQK